MLALSWFTRATQAQKKEIAQFFSAYACAVASHVQTGIMLALMRMLALHVNQA